MNDDALVAVLVKGENAVGVIIQHLAYGARVRWTDVFGIEHEEFLDPDDYVELEEWEEQ